MDCLMLRLDAPLMSFGGVVVDQINPVEDFPGRSMLSGLLANALGLDHGDSHRIQSLQDRLKHASRWDAEPDRIVDYHTVDLGQDFMMDVGWTTRGHREDRGKGDATSATHQRWRHFWANGCVTVSLTLLDAGGGEPGLDVVESALRYPARPIFIGRKTCLPAAPLLLGRRSAESLRGALSLEPLADPLGRRAPLRVRACWPAEEGPGAQTVELDDLRDWPNNIHRGRQPYSVGFLEISS